MINFRILRLFALLWLAIASPSVLAAAIPYPAAQPDGERFLFILDMSEDMERLQATSENALYELIGTGVNGHMRTGDTFGLWTFNKETQAGQFSMKIWDHRRAIQQATVAAAFVSGLNYEKTSNIKDVTEKLRSIAHAVSNVNALIITDGGTSMRGTPFDKEINAAYKSRKSERRTSKRPFVTTLIIRDGWIIDQSVAIAGERIALPDRRPPPSFVQPAAPQKAVVPAAVSTNSIIVTRAAPVVSTPVIAQTPAPAPAAAQVPPPLPEPKKVMVITSKTNSPEALPAPMVANAKPEAPASAPATPITAASPAPPQPAPPAKVLEVASQASLLAATPPARATPTSAPPSAQSVAPVARPAAVSVIDGAIATLLPEPMTVAAREVSSPSADASTPAPVPVPTPLPNPTLQGMGLPGQQHTGGGWLLVVGGFLLGAALLLAVSVLRRGRASAGASLITESMNRR